MPTGTHTVADLQRITDTTAAEFGLDAIRETLQADLDAHNAIVDEMLTDLADPTTEREDIYGASIDGEMLRSDEYDRGAAVKLGEGSNVGFPLYKFVKPIGWTHDFMLQNTPARIANTVLGIQEMHIRAVRRELLTAVFGAANFTVRDEFVSPQINLGVKRLVNADGAAIPNGPFGETFDVDAHTHYDYLDGAAPTAAFLTGLIDDLVEHGHGNRVLININKAAEAAVRLLTGFVPYYEAGVDPGANAARGVGTLNTQQTTNRAIGRFGGAEIWTRSWVPAGYVFVYDAASPMKPLAYRQHPVATIRGLRIVAEIADYPLYAQVMDSYFGFGAKTRTNGVVGYYATSASAYVEPTIS
jgi:hypothetical protein